MKIECIPVGYLECNCYILDIDDNVIVIDPGDKNNKIINKIGNRNVVGIVITHHHFDHIGALEDIVNKYDVDVYDRYNLSEGENNIANFCFYVIYTPGHKEDAISIYFKEYKAMFVGDFIFKEDIGRCDLKGGNINDMIKSINKIKKYDKNIVIYPGHGDITMIEHEINNNIYFKGDKDVF